MTKSIHIKLLIAVAVILTSCGTQRKSVNNSRKNSTQKVVSKKEIDQSVSRNQTTKKLPNYKKPTSQKPVFKDNNERYVYDYAQIAKDEMALYGIPASITLAQGILESSAGNGELTLKSNNHFGIKCNGWQGEKAYHDDDALQECFRKYKDPKYSFRDHSLFLKERKRYAFLFDLDKDDYKGWAHGLKKAGYATDPRYPQKLISIIERYQLHQYDDHVLGNGSRKGNRRKAVRADHTSIRYTVQKGDTLYTIAKRYDLSVDELKALNKLKDNHLSIGQKLYVKSL